MDPNPDEIASLEAEKHRAYEIFEQKIGAAHTELLAELGRIRERLQQVFNVKGELPVLIRITPGPEVTIYHSATHPCGRVTGRHRDRGNYRQLLEREARARYLTRCSACHWFQAERSLVEQRPSQAG